MPTPAPALDAAQRLDAVPTAAPTTPWAWPGHLNWIAEEGAFLATMPDWPEVNGGQPTRADSIRDLVDSLGASLLMRLAHGRDLPPWRAAAADQVLITAPPSAVAKALLMDAFNAGGLTKSALADLLGRPESRVREMLDPRRTRVNVDDVAQALAALGRPLVLTTQPGAADALRIRAPETPRGRPPKN